MGARILGLLAPRRASGVLRRLAAGHLRQRRRLLLDRGNGGPLQQRSVVALALVLAFFAAVAGLYAAVFAWGFGSVRRAAGRWWPLGVAAWFTAVEFLNPQMFPYFQGVAWYRVPSIFLVTALTGVSGVTFLVILCNGVVFQAVEEMRGSGPAAPRAWAANAGVLVALVAVAFAWSAVRLARIRRAEAEAESLRVALVQPNYDVVRRRELRRKGPGVFAEDLVALSREAARASRRHRRLRLA